MHNTLLKRFLNFSSGDLKSKTCTERSRSIQNLKWAGLLVILTLLLASVGVATAQQPKKIPRIGFLFGAAPTAQTGRIEAFRQGLRKHGYTEGKSIVIEQRYAEVKLDRLPALAAELVGIVVLSPVLNSQRTRIVDLAIKGRLPAMYFTAVGGRRGADELRGELYRLVPARSHLRGQDFERRQAWRSASGTTDEIRAANQPQNRQADRAHDSANRARKGGPGHQVRRGKCQVSSEKWRQPVIRFQVSGVRPFNRKYKTCTELRRSIQSLEWNGGGNHGTESIDPA